MMLASTVGLKVIYCRQVELDKMFGASKLWGGVGRDREDTAAKTLKR